MKAWGLRILVGGVLMALYFFLFFDVGVDVPKQEILGQTIGGERVANIDLMATRQNGIIIGLAIALFGVILVAVGRNEADAGTGLCPFCKAAIPLDATKCRFCASEIKRQEAPAQELEGGCWKCRCGVVNEPNDLKCECGRVPGAVF